jgi:RES domain-containing protein
LGYYKERFFSRGLSPVEGSVCGPYLGDRGLSEFVAGIASDLQCDFCGQESGTDPIAAPVDDVVSYMEECISREYEGPANSVGWCSAEGGWLAATVFHTDELLSDELGLDLPNDDGTLLDALCNGLGGAAREWVRIDPYGLPPEDVYRWSWEDFSRLVKHGRRFFFRDHPRDADSELLPPQELLQRIAEFCLANGLVRVFPAGSRLYRVRKQRTGEALCRPLQLGPPPAALARLPTRMSPAGIQMFYGADDPITALRETEDGAGTYATACFEITRDILILDLTNAPTIPSIFEPLSDSAETDPRYELMFLSHFVREVAAPIDRDDRAHVDYVPTQVVAEYFRSFALPDGRRVDGIRYTSAQHPPKACYALFAEQRHVIPSTEEIAAMDGLEIRIHEKGWLGLIDVFQQLVP